jgi:hypothetical protein
LGIVNAQHLPIINLPSPHLLLSEQALARTQSLTHPLRRQTRPQPPEQRHQTQRYSELSYLEMTSLKREVPHPYGQQL